MRFAASTLLLLASSCLAKTITYDWNVTWVTANPDGLADRKVVGINGKWPLPVVEVDRGDRLVVNMYNGLGDKNTSIHWHGMYQNGTNYMDGPSMVTQCPVPPGASLTYNFTVNQNGTYWYHCHTDACYPDGYRQALIVRDTDSFFHNDYEEDITITLSDWYHHMTEGLKEKFLSLYNPTGAEPIPDAFLFNDTLNSSIPVKPNTTYLLRLINIGAFVAQYFYIEGHSFKIVEIDGVYTEPAEADILYIGVAQRYSILLTTKNETDKNYAIVTVADSDLLDTIPETLQLNNTNWLEYNKAAPHEKAVVQVDQSSDLDPFDDITLVPHDRMPLLPEPDVEVNLTVYMNNLDNGFNYAFFNNITYTRPKVPSLFSVLSSGDLSTNPTVYGTNTHPFVFEHNNVVQVIINNGDTGSHPFHLHGHNFQVIDRAPGYGPNFNSYLNGDPVPYDPSNHTAFPEAPPRRDTVVLPPQGYMVLRFVADNPGVWFFHCHIDWHLSSGLASVFIEAPTQMQERLTIPADHQEVCRLAGVPFEGNAAANTEDLLDLSGQNVQPGQLPSGFTARGIVALVFSCISAVLGMISIFVYGMSDIKFKNQYGAAEADVSQPMDEIPAGVKATGAEVEPVTIAEQPSKTS
ncbi:iron transport multicopper oxidase FET3 [Paecilomyces variotii No. 5]|uniref:Iron transport multicopper oxidase FET3 n=1 Tax=Byssochlamys spectabilis (strain No. 5 / NBRC 109023) TaxID=1356009 RepID=V5FW50_BYSSN|nr:iron transport multicopper oxidase FET3 [Paecilomyces variotii No. 5]